MKKIAIKKRTRGSILLAVIAVLSVFSMMAMRFNVEMETAMIKIQGKSLASDAKVLAQSGLMYCIAGILKNGKNFRDDSSKASSYDREQLAIEEELELRLGNNNESASEGEKRNTIGSGAPEFGAVRYNAGRFWNMNNSSVSMAYIPEGMILDSCNISFLVEDLSGKLPVGHVSQLFQRHLISTVLAKLLTNKTPVLKGVNHEGFQEIDSELFEESNFKENPYDKTDGNSIYVRSLIPFEIARKVKANSGQLNFAGIPLADGIFATEELGSSYSWVNYKNKESEKRHATDYPRSAKEYLLLAGALTPFSRFVHETRFSDCSTNIAHASPVSYASINPMVMYQQNERLYYALFNYAAVDLKLRLYFSVSCDPKPNSVGIFATDDKESQIAAYADPNFFRNKSDPYILSTPMTQTIMATSSNIVYNARDDKSDLHELPKMPFICEGVTPESKRYWGDAEFLTQPDLNLNSAVGRSIFT